MNALQQKAEDTPTRRILRGDFYEYGKIEKAINTGNDAHLVRF